MVCNCNLVIGKMEVSCQNHLLTVCNDLAGKKLEGDKTFCSICEVNFGCAKEAEEHFGGPNHVRRLCEKPKLRRGYVNDGTGKWHAMPVGKEKKVSGCEEVIGRWCFVFCVSFLWSGFVCLRLVHGLGRLHFLPRMAFSSDIY